jgi:predicted CoA-binding protein
MQVSNPPDSDIAALLARRPRVALVGASDKSARASNSVMRFLLERGFAVVPVNPVLAGRTIHGQPVVATLAEAAPLDMVDVFRRREEAGAVVDEAAALGARAVWLQLDVVDEAAAARARDQGVLVVQDRCPAIEWPRLRVT